MILDRRVSVLPRNLSIAIDIASSSCPRTVTTVLAGELVELESLLVLNIKLGKVEAERCQGGDSRSGIVQQKALTGQDVLPGWRPAFDFADACTTHGVKSGCDSSENGFPKENEGHGHGRLFLFLVPNLSTVRLPPVLTCVDPSGRRNAGPGSILHQHDEWQAIITLDRGIFVEGSLTVEAKKAKKSEELLWPAPQLPLH